MSSRYSQRTKRKKRNDWGTDAWQGKVLWAFIGGLVFLYIFLLIGPELNKPSLSENQVVSVALLKQNRPFDLVYGPDHAPVTIVEYASLTCGHCKSFHQNVVGPLKQSGFYNGKVRVVFRHYPLNKPALDAAVLLSCAPQGQAKKILDTLFLEQKKWALAEAPLIALKQYFTNAGMSEADIYTCLADEKRAESIVSEHNKARNELGVNFTPTAFVNEALYTGPNHINSLHKVIVSELEKNEENGKRR